jgi:RimJ/RimL family protein N-acetyltransferase
MKQKIRVYLRALEPDDYLQIHRWRADRDVARNFGGIPLFSSSLNEKKWVEEKIFDKGSVSCAICLKKKSEFIGCIFLNDIDMHNRTGHAPIFIGEKKYWGQGYATDARMVLLRYAFLERGLNRVWARVLSDNGAALKMLEKTGYKREGVMRQSTFRDGQFMDEVMLAVLRKDFLPMMENYEF